MLNEDKDIKMINENYWRLQANKIAGFLIDQGFNETTARYKANECVKKQITYNEFITIQGDVMRFENNSIRAKEDPQVEVKLNGNVKKKTADKKIVKKVMGVVLTVTFCGMVLVGVKEINTLSANEKFGELAVNIASTQYEQAEDVEMLESDYFLELNDMALDIVGRHKQVEYDGYNLPTSSLNVDGVSRDILSVCTNHPEFFDSVLYSVYGYVDDIGLENENVTSEVRTSNRLYYMDRIISCVKRLADQYGYDEIANELAHVETSADYIFQVVLSEEEINDEMQIAKNEYNEIAKNTTLGYAYSHLSDTKYMDKLLRDYRTIMNKRTQDQVESISAYYEQLKSNAELDKEGKSLS